MTPTFHKLPQSWQATVYAESSRLILERISEVASIMKQAGAKRIDLQLVLEMVSELSEKKYGKR